ncbi:MAG: hypothetical protein ISS52_07135 [Dehalococcoidia bacterium]|nr:hypothetical protein [Dehalococcoidia bacterium]
MDYRRKMATAAGMLLAIIVLCSGAGYFGHVHGHTDGYEAGYESGLREGVSGYNLHNPTYQEMNEFLAEDTTSLKAYVEDEYVCVDFSAEVNNNAEAQGIRCAIVDVFYPEGYGHTIVAFETADRGLKFVEPQFDEEVSLIVGKSYSETNDYTPPPKDDTIKRFLVIW